MTPKALLTAISAGKFKTAYYFSGSEDYRITEAEKYLAREFLPNRQMMTNYRRINGKSTSAADLMAELSVFPMLGERQVFAVSNFQRYKPTEVKRILKLLDPPDPNRIVIFSSPSDKTPKKTSAFFKAMTAAAECVQFGKLSFADTEKIISAKLKKAELNIEKDALRMLTEMIAGNRGALESETLKLADFKQPGETVTVEDIRAVSSGFQVYSIFDLADYVVEGSLKKVLAMINSLIAEGNSPTGLLYHLGSHFVSLYLVKNGKPLAPQRRWLTTRFKQQASKYSNGQLESMIDQIATTDAELRQSRAKPELVLETLVVNLVREAEK